MQTLLYGTGNAGKLAAMRGHLAGLPLRIIGLNEITADLPAIDESGNDPLENAKIKALAYHKAIGMPVFSCDSGLYIQGAPEALQPGVHVRNVNGKQLNDEEMIAHYSALAAQLGGNITVQYRNAICLVLSENEVFTHMGDDIAGDVFLLTAKPHPARTPGFPLDSLSVHIETGMYYYDMAAKKDLSRMDEGFCAFFSKALKINLAL